MLLTIHRFQNFRFLPRSLVFITKGFYVIYNDKRKKIISESDYSPVLLQYLDEIKTTLDDPCISCTGLLQENSIESSIEKTSHEILKGEYDCDTFTVALTIPVVIALRERSLLIYLSQSLKLSNDSLNNIKLHMKSVKDVWKMIAIPRIEKMVEKIGEAPKGSVSFLVDIIFSYSQDEEECLELLTSCKIDSDKRNSSVTHSRKNIDAILQNLSDEQFEVKWKVPPNSAKSFVTVEKVNCAHISILIGGRYCKLSRNLCQTPWFINGEKKMGTSVQELLCDQIVEYTKADSMKFLSSGREDVDVRTLNEGRPFAVELINPKVTKIPDDLTDLVLKINENTDDVRIIGNLRVISKFDLKKLKEGENKKSKNYRALCIYKPKSNTVDLIKNLNELANLKIIQKTPIRVLHRRPLVSRVRIVHLMRTRLPRPGEFANFTEGICNLGENNSFILDLETQAGTYVKEFVHGDFGRTLPNLCDLLQTDVDIIALDVTRINLEWP